MSIKEERNVLTMERKIKMKDSLVKQSKIKPKRKRTRSKEKLEALPVRGDVKNLFKIGHPPKFKTPEALQKKIEEYFVSEFDCISKFTMLGDEIKIPVLTITGLCLFCGFADRHSFYDYEKRKEFSHTIKRARSFIENDYEKQIKTGNPTGGIFALKNFGWKDKFIVDDSASEFLFEEHKDISIDELKRMGREIIGRRITNI